MKKSILLLLIVAILNLHPQNQVDLTVSIQEGGGFFAELHKVVSALIHYQDSLVNIHVDWSDEFFPYKNGATENGWDLFFKPIKAPTQRDPNQPVEKVYISSSAEFHEMHDQVCTCPWVQKGYEEHLPYRRYINSVLSQFIELQPDMYNRMMNFYNTHMKNHVCIGVHIRMAKQHRALVPGKKLPILEDYYEEIDRLLEIHQDEPVKIFVASDCHQAVATLKERYPDKAICINAYRSASDNDPCIMYTSGSQMRENKELWHRMKHKYSGGVSTLLDCLLLAKCDYLIHTTSNLAFFAAYYNPDIKTIYLPKDVPYEECRFKNEKWIKNRYITGLS